MRRENEEDSVFENDSEFDSLLGERWITSQDGMDTFETSTLIRLSIEADEAGIFCLYGFLDMGSELSNDLVLLGNFKSQKEAIYEKRRLMDWLVSEMTARYEEFHVMPDHVSINDF